MATLRTYLRAFNGGEVSPGMFARIDDSKYQTGMAQCTNFLVEPQGPICMRPGFSYVNLTKDQDRAPNLIPFVFNLDQAFVLEFGEKYIRVHTQGMTLMNADGTAPYEVETPYLADEVFDIHYVQSADVVTLVHPNHAPRELRRYGATDWRLVEISFASTLKAPTGLKVKVHINSSVQNKEDYTREYAVTALDADGKNESVRSKSVSVKCNPYGEGAYNVITWDVVDGAGRYRVYRNEGGIWGYIGESTETSITDEGISIDASITPPIYDDAFRQAKGISSVSVTSQGSGYTNNALAVLGEYDVTIFNLLCIGTFKYNHDENGFRFLSHEPDRTAEEIHRLLGEGPGIRDVFVSPGSAEYNALDEKAKALADKGCIAFDTSEVRFNACEVSDIYDSVESIGDRGYSMSPGSPGSGATVSYKTYVCKNRRFLYDFQVKTGGQNYARPIVMIRYKPVNDNYKQWWYLGIEFELKVSSVPRLVVTDSTGYGAELVPVVTDGKITSVNIISGGTGYTAPTITAVSTTGSGAAFSAEVGQVGDYPSAVSYFEQRRFFAGTPQRPTNIWATKSGTESDMSYSLPTQDDDRIAVRAAAREANRIQHIVPLSQLIMLTPSTEWRVTSLNSDAITPTSISIRPQSYVGASNVQPLVIANQMIYAAARGGHLRECGYSYEAGGFISNDISLRASHLFDNKTIRSMAYSKSPWPTVWAVSSDGRLIAMTYVPEQQVGAFSTVKTTGAIEAVCSIPEGDEDVLYAVIRRPIAGVMRRFIERMHERQFTTLEDSVFLDCSGTYRGDLTTEVNGLTWLEGEEVVILADGGVEPTQVVTDGKITLTHAASVIHVGIPYTADMKTLPAAFSLQDGSFGSGHQKNVRKVWFRVVDSGGLKAGPSFDSLAEYPSRTTEFAGHPPDPLSDEFGFEVSATWSPSGQVCVRQDNPLPLRIISMTTELEIV